METRRYHNLIDGTWAPPSSGDMLSNVNPADTSDVIGDFPNSNQEDVERAVAAARVAYQSWRLVPAPKRAEILFRAGELLLERKEQFSQEMTREMGKVLMEARGDVQEAIDMTFFIAGEGRRLHGNTAPSELNDKFAMSIRVPLGVAGIITPWNFPMAIPSWKIIPALVTGNTVVFKPAPDTPLSAYNFVKTLCDAGVPKGVLNLVYGGGEEVGAPLVNHPDVSIISFTGSTEVGRGINQSAASRFKRVSLEMGGKNGILIHEDADLRLALEGALWGGFGTSGQRCTAASRLLLHEKVYDEFAAQFVNDAKKLRVGNGLDPHIDMGPIINEKQLHRIEKYVQIGKEEGARLLCGGHRLRGGSFDLGYFYAPTIFGEVDRKMRIAREEIFGPVVCMIRVKNLDEAIDICNDTEYGLSSAIYTSNVQHAFRAMRDLYTGITYVNASTIGAETHMPFGGTKQTGNGHREGGPTVLDLYTEWKSVYVDFSGKLQKAQIDNQ